MIQYNLTRQDTGTKPAALTTPTTAATPATNNPYGTATPLSTPNPYGYSGANAAAGIKQGLQPPAFPSGGQLPGMSGMTPTMAPTMLGGIMGAEESYIENILRLNLGKIATIYMTFENNLQWNAKIFKGRLEAAGRDHIIISDPQTGRRELLLMVNLDFITFDEPLNYAYPYAGQPVSR